MYLTKFKQMLSIWPHTSAHSVSISVELMAFSMPSIVKSKGHLGSQKVSILNWCIKDTTFGGKEGVLAERNVV